MEAIVESAHIKIHRATSVRPFSLLEVIRFSI